MGQLTVYQLGSAPGRPEAVAGLPVSLPPRLGGLAGREELLAELDARLTGGDGPWPRVVALHGLGGAGKTTVAVEYAHRHLAEVGLAWQFPAEDATVLVAEFGRLAELLGAAGGVLERRDPVAAVHAVLAGESSPWLLVFDNAPDSGAVREYLPPAGKGRVLITSRGALWPPGQGLEVPPLEVPNTVSPHATWEYSWIRPPSRSRRRTRILAPAAGGLWRPAGGFWCSALCGRWVL